MVTPCGLVGYSLVNYGARLIGRESVAEASQTWREADRVRGCDGICRIGGAFLKLRCVMRRARPRRFSNVVAGAV